MLQIDTSRPLRTHTQLRELVVAVVQAGHYDELDWVEWKSLLDLSDHEGRGVIGFHILGMANRDPDTAARVAGGCGYILVGVEPGNCHGIPPVDPADLEPQVQRFLGANGPTWQPVWVEYEGNHVLVVIVDPPQQADPIWTLASDFRKYRPGAVLVRRTGSTHQANPEEVRRLTARAQPQDTTPRLSIALGPGADPLAVKPIALRKEAFAHWLDEERHRLMAPLERTQGEADEESSEPEGFDSRPTTEVDGPRADALRSAAKMQRIVDQTNRISRGFMKHKPEDRSPDEYRDQVEDYLARAEDVLREVVIDRHIHDGDCDVKLTASNPTDWPYREVEIEMFIPGAGVRAIDQPPGARVPSPPRLWGDQWVNSLAQLWGPSSDLAIQGPLLPATDFDLGSRPSLHIDNSGSARLTFPPVDLAPHSTVVLEDFALLVPADFAGQAISATWKARSVHVRGIDDGTLQIQIDGKAADAADLLRRSKDDTPDP